MGSGSGDLALGYKMTAARRDSDQMVSFITVSPTVVNF